MDLNSESLNIISSIRSSGEIAEIELDLVPSLIKPHGHGADEWLDSGGGLIVGSSKSSSYVLIIKDLDLECKVFLKVLDDHD